MRICNCFKENSNIDSFEERTQKCSEVVTIVSSFVAAGFTLTFSLLNISKMGTSVVRYQDLDNQDAKYDFLCALILTGIGALGAGSLITDVVRRYKEL